jgi:uncharacterized protein (DUF305 family)
MSSTVLRMSIPAVVLASVLVSCRSTPADRIVLTPAAMARADGGQPPFTEADVRFLTAMIPHHAQAILIASWAPTHGAGAAVSTLAERIVVAQQDEISFAENWLRERKQPVPEADASHHLHGTDSSARMPGMLSAEQLSQLDAARGAEFDRLFLTFMIQHHEGAITMVEQLFDSNGAAQDDDIFRFAADVNVDQITEIDRMRSMLAAQESGGRKP